MTSIITALIAVFGALAAAALPYVAQGIRAGRLRKELGELTDMRSKFDSADPQRQVITELIKVRLDRLVQLMGTVKLRGWLITASVGMVLTIATLGGTGIYLQHRATKALADYSSGEASASQLLLKGIIAAQAQPADESTARTTLAQFKLSTDSALRSEHAYNTDSDWAQGLIYAGLALTLLTAVSLALVIGRLILQTRSDRRGRPRTQEEE